MICPICRKPVKIIERWNNPHEAPMHEIVCCGVSVRDQSANVVERTWASLFEQNAPFVVPGDKYLTERFSRGGAPVEQKLRYVSDEIVRIAERHSATATALGRLPDILAGALSDVAALQRGLSRRTSDSIRHRNRLAALARAVSTRSRAAADLIWSRLPDADERVAVVVADLERSIEDAMPYQDIDHNEGEERADALIV